jgi:transposase
VEKKLPEVLAEIDRQWPDERPLRLLFQDEARFGRIADVRRCWCPKPVRPVCRAMVTQEYTYAYAAVSVLDGGLDTLILPRVNGTCMQLFLDEVAARHAQERIVMVLDGAGWHQSGSLKLPDNLRLLPLPPYSPELNPVEHLWDELREKAFHNRVFDSIDALEDHLEVNLRALENNHDRVCSIVAWPWIIDSLLK